jgi:hypothetical protein
MSLLEEIQQEAVDGKTDLSTLLRKCKLLAARLGSKPLEDWLLWEANGYPKDAPVPEYRIWRLNLKGHFAGYAGAALNAVPIPLACLPKESREGYERYESRQSVAAIEAIVKLDEKETGTLSISTGDLAMVLGSKVYQNMNCIQAWAEVENSRLVEVLNSVRNRILDFAIAVWKEAPAAGQAEGAVGAAIMPAAVTQIFNTTVYGGAANLVGSAHNSTVSFGITPGDFESLAKILTENKVSPAELADLKAAVIAEPKPKVGGSFGPKVSAWFGKMIQKASDGSWEVGIQAAGALLGQAIAKYYGIG